MAEQQEQQPIIIKKKKKGGGHAPHGGAWKVAYADFVTAMMAFFLLLWLLNVSTSEQKSGLSEYFQPSMASSPSSGAGNILGGQTIAESGKIGSPKTVVAISPENVGKNVPQSGPVKQEGDKGGIKKKLEGEEGKNTKPGKAKKGEKGQAPGNAKQGDKGSSPGKGGPAARQERAQFKKAAQQLQQAVASSPELKDLQDNIMVDQVPQGLRIQLVDQQDYSMFPSGSAVLYDRTEKLLQEVSKVVQKLPNSISIAGHTNAVSFQQQAGYTNWELSTDRANASRRALVDAGLNPERIANVVGKADQDLLLENKPKSPQNRRISITLLSEEGAPQPALAGTQDTAY